MRTGLDRRRFLSVATAVGVGVVAGCSTRTAVSRQPSSSPSARSTSSVAPVSSSLETPSTTDSTVTTPSTATPTVPSAIVVDRFGVAVDASASFDPTVVLYGTVGVFFDSDSRREPDEGGAVVWDTVDETRVRRLGTGTVPLPTQDGEGRPETTHADRGVVTPLPGRPGRRFTIHPSALSAPDTALVVEARLLEFVFSPVAAIRDTGRLTRRIPISLSAGLDVDTHADSDTVERPRAAAHIPVTLDGTGGRTEFALVFDVSTE